VNKSRPFRIILESLADLSNRSIDAVIGIEKNVLTPDPLYNLLAGDQLAALLHQKQEQLHWDASEFDGLTCSSEFIRAEVEFKDLSKSD
jgi:hypothetical protein